MRRKNRKSKKHWIRKKIRREEIEAWKRRRGLNN